jgi:hypothetical protein
MEQMTDALERLADKMETDDEGAIWDSLVKAFKNSKLDVGDLKEFGATLQKIAHRNPKMKGSERALQVSFAAVMVADAADVAYGRTTPKTVNEAAWGLLSNRLLRDYTAAVQNEESERSRDSLLLSVKNLASAWALDDFNAFLKELKYFAELPASQNKREEVFRDVWQKSDAKRIKQINSNLARFDALFISIRLQLPIDDGFDESKRELILSHLDIWPDLRRVVTSDYASPETKAGLRAVDGAMAVLDQLYRGHDKDSRDDAEPADNVESRLARRKEKDGPRAAIGTRVRPTKNRSLINRQRSPKRPKPAMPRLRPKADAKTPEQPRTADAQGRNNPIPPVAAKFEQAAKRLNIPEVFRTLHAIGQVNEIGQSSAILEAIKSAKFDQTSRFSIQRLNTLMEYVGKKLPKDDDFDDDGRQQLRALYGTWLALKTLNPALNVAAEKSLPRPDRLVAKYELWSLFERKIPSSEA